MKLHLRNGVAFLAAVTLLSTLSLSAGAQSTEFKIKPRDPGGPAPRLADGHVDFSGLWLPNRAGMGGLGGFQGVDPAARRQFDPKVTPEEPPPYQPWAAAKIKAMTRTELELSKSSVNCMPRGIPAIWLQNPYSTKIVSTPGQMVQLYEVLNNFRVIPTDGRPHSKFPEPLFHGEGVARYEGDTLVVDGVSFDERTYVMPNGWFHSDQMHVVERYTRPSKNYMVVQITVEDPKVLTKPWKSAPREWTLAVKDEIYEFYCTNNPDLEELQEVRKKEIEADKK